MSDLQKAEALAKKVPGTHCAGVYPEGPIQNIEDGDHLYVMETETDVQFYRLSQYDKIVTTKTFSVDKSDLDDPQMQEALNEWFSGN